MKKLLLVLFVTLFSLNIFADNRSCEVWNTELTATVEDAIYTSINDYIKPTIKLDGPAPRPIKIAINVYDLKGTYITSDVIEIGEGRKEGYKNITVGYGKTCVVKINNASCK